MLDPRRQSRRRNTPRKLKEAKERCADDLLIVMRVYFEKPRTTVGWKGLINDPNLDGSFRINDGLRVGAATVAGTQRIRHARRLRNFST